MNRLRTRIDLAVVRTVESSEFHALLSGPYYTPSWGWVNPESILKGE